MENMVMQPTPLPDPAFWQGKRVLLTGHTGFKGAWLAFWLRQLGAQVWGLALPAAPGSLYSALNLDAQLHSCLADIRQVQAVRNAVAQARPQHVFHLAAQSLVRPGYQDPLGTFATNVMGTAHVLDALRGQTELLSVLCITTDKVYKSRDGGVAYREEDALGGDDPYSASKAATEHVIACYRRAYLEEEGVPLAVARAGNVIGGGDMAEERLLPDAVRAWRAGVPLEVRRPDAVRPWQHVLEPLNAYLILSERLSMASADSPLAGAWNFGPDDAATVREVIRIAKDVYGSGEIRYASTPSGPHEAHWLALDARKARHVLHLCPRWSLTQAVTRSMEWYRDFSAGQPAQHLCARDVHDFVHEGAMKAKTTR